MGTERSWRVNLTALGPGDEDWAHTEVVEAAGVVDALGMAGDGVAGPDWEPRLLLVSVGLEVEHAD